MTSSRALARLAACAVAAALASCDGGASSGAAPKAASLTFEGVASVHAEEGVAADTLRGVVRFVGAPPARRPLPVSAGTGCGDGAPSTDTLIVTDGRVADVLVHAKRGVKPETVAPAPSEFVLLDQRGCVYSPHVVALRVGQPLAVRNSDSITHNVNAKPQRSERFNVSQTPGAPDLVQRFERPELSIPLGCDIHPWMSARVHVLDNDAFGLTSPDGEFEIHGLAPGAYRFEAQHEWLGSVDFDVEFDGIHGVAVELEFRRSGAASD